MGETIYAVKAVDGKEVNKIFYSWDGEEGCKALVFGHDAIYRSFTDAEEACKFLQTAPLKKTENFGKGYIPTQAGKHVMYGKYKLDRCSEKTDGYCVKVYETSKGERFSCVGYKLPDNPRLTYAFTGSFINDPKYGYEFIVESYTEHISDTKNDVIAYLSCGIIRGIGPKKAEKIYERFGSASLEILEKKPEKLLCIKGISKGVLDKIVASYKENMASREITSFLLKFGISQKYGMLLYNKYGVSAVQKVTENPYLLCLYKGLTFKDADRIAKETQYPLDSYIRFESCAYYVLKNNEMTGNCGMEIIDFQTKVYKLLTYDGIQKKDIYDKTCEMVKNHALCTKRLPDAHGKIRQYIFTSSMVQLEHTMAVNILNIEHSSSNRPDTDLIHALIQEAESFYAVSLDKTQRKAVFEAISNNICAITGNPGTGKTMTISIINYVYQKLYPDNDRVFLAPTGRAARIITEKTGEDAHTGQSYLKMGDNRDVTEDYVLIRNSLVIMDETSMADIYLASALFDAIQENCKVVLVGDVDQLPSVGPGAVLRDIIESQMVPVVILDQIYRQGEDSQIYENSRKINQGITELSEGEDFHFHECSSMEDMKHEMAHKYISLTEEYGLGNVMMLCPFKEHTAGIYDMNSYIQQLVNPKKDNELEVTYHKYTFRKGDLVMHVKTNTKEVANGDIGKICMIKEHVDKDGFSEEEEYDIIVEINNKHICYTKDTMDCLELAYATTVHKAQGGAAPAVITCLTEYHRSMLYRNIPYVAVSRGRKCVEAYGQKTAWDKAILNEDIEKMYRITLLKYYLQYEGGEFVMAS